MTILQQMAGRVAGISRDPLPDDVSHAARRCVVDWFSAALPGSMEAPATLLRKSMADELGHGGARLLPDGLAAPARTAAFINGAASHTIEFDDIYKPGLYHPGSPVIAAVLAVAQSERLSGDRFLHGVVCGYEMSNRIAEAVQPSHYEFFHTTGTVGAIGAAAGAAAALGLPADQLAHAAATAATFSSGLQQAFRADAMTKPLHAAHAADVGVMAAQAARHGVTGAMDILEGPVGFGAAMSKGVNWEQAVERLNAGYTMLQITQKNHTCCGHTFAAVDAVLKLRSDHGLTADNVAQIRAGTYSKALDVCATNDPQSPYQARFSLSYCLAAALVTGGCRLAAFTPERLADPVIRDVMTRVRAEVDATADRLFPSTRSATVEITTRDGRVFSHHAPARRGDPEDPLSDQEVTDKLTDLAASVIGVPAARRLADQLWQLDRTPDLYRLFDEKPAAA
ncbi:MAG: MmgE/PrpD family protein [Rhodospirillales bacterium]